MGEAEQPEVFALTPEQEEVADMLLEITGLSEVADRQIVMFEGQPATSIRDGLGLCADRIEAARLTPTQVQQMVMTRLEAVVPPTTPPA